MRRWTVAGASQFWPVIPYDQLLGRYDVNMIWREYLLVSSMERYSNCLIAVLLSPNQALFVDWVFPNLPSFDLGLAVNKSTDIWLPVIFSDDLEEPHDYELLKKDEPESVKAKESEGTLSGSIHLVMFCLAKYLALLHISFRITSVFGL